MYWIANFFEGMKVVQELGGVPSLQQMVGLELLQFLFQQGLWQEGKSVIGGIAPINR